MRVILPFLMQCLQDQFYRGTAVPEKVVFNDDTDASACDAKRCRRLISFVKSCLVIRRKSALEEMPAPEDNSVSGETVACRRDGAAGGGIFP